MTDCIQVDPPNERDYYKLRGYVHDVEGSRMIRFLGRHDLWEKFKAEDAAGKR